MKLKEITICGLAVAGVAAAGLGIKKIFFSKKKRKQATAFVESADEVDITLVNEKSGDVVETTSADDVIIPIEKLPEEFKKVDNMGKRITPLTLDEIAKMKQMKEDGYSIMLIAKKYHLSRKHAYGIFYSLKRENVA